MNAAGSPLSQATVCPDRNLVPFVLTLNPDEPDLDVTALRAELNAIRSSAATIDGLISAA